MKYHPLANIFPLMKGEEAVTMRVFFVRPNVPNPHLVSLLKCDIATASHRLAFASAWCTDTEITGAIVDSPAASKIAILNLSDLTRGEKAAVSNIRDKFGESWDKHTDGLPFGCSLSDFPPPQRFVVLGGASWKEGVMHHKFIVADNVVWTGSYNFTFQARKNYENLLRIDSPKLADTYWGEAENLAGLPDADRTDMYEPICDTCEKHQPMYLMSEIDSHGGGVCIYCAQKERSGGG